MSLNPRAVALQGVGFAVAVLAVQGLTTVAATTSIYEGSNDTNYVYHHATQYRHADHFPHLLAILIRENII